MAYSRWSDSHWYIYWSTSSGHKKNEQILVVLQCGNVDAKTEYKYLEIKQMLKGKDFSKIGENLPEIETLIESCEAFVSDINEEFKRKRKK